MTLEEAEKHFFEWSIGIFLLIAALVITSYLAIVQESLYSRFGKHPREVMFYTHALSLPFFALFGADIYRNMLLFNHSPALSFLGVSTGIPTLWLNLLGACIGQWVCILFVYRLNSEVDSLTVTLVVTLRKFLSLLISIFWFGNVFTFFHWVGAFLVFGGTIYFSDFNTSKSKPKPKKE